jgi:hypothetical protein
VIPGAPPPAPEPDVVYEIQVYCPRCGAAVLIGITDWPDGTRHVACPSICDGSHPLTESEREALIRRAFELLERGADAEPAN